MHNTKYRTERSRKYQGDTNNTLHPLTAEDGGSGGGGGRPDVEDDPALGVVGVAGAAGVDDAGAAAALAHLLADGVVHLLVVQLLGGPDHPEAPRRLLLPVVRLESHLDGGKKDEATMEGRLVTLCMLTYCTYCERYEGYGS